MNMTVVFLAGGVFLFGVVAYVMFMIFLPEWVGITGKKALEAQEAHRGDTQASSPGEQAKNKDEKKS